MEQLAQLNPEDQPSRGIPTNPTPPPAPASASSSSSLPAALPGLAPIARQVEDARVLSSRLAAGWFHQVQGIVWRQVKEAQFKTNDLVELLGGLDKRDKRMLYINNLRAIKVGRVELLFLLILAFAALTRAGLPTPWRVEAKKEFLTWDQIADEIIRMERAFPGLKALHDLTYNEIARAAWRLRKKIKAAGGNRDLIETGVVDRGYRLSSHPINFRILVREFNIAGPFAGFPG